MLNFISSVPTWVWWCLLGFAIIIVIRSLLRRTIRLAFTILLISSLGISPFAGISTILKNNQISFDDKIITIGAVSVDTEKIASFEKTENGIELEMKNGKTFSFELPGTATSLIGHFLNSRVE